MIKYSDKQAIFIGRDQNSSPEKKFLGKTVSYESALK